MSIGVLYIETDRKIYCPCFKWVPYMLGTTTQSPNAEPGHTAR